jgi:hypothetical protein
VTTGRRKSAIAVCAAIVAAYAATFAVVALLIDASFATIVRFYAPVLVLFLIVAGGQAARTRSAGWTLIAASFAISLVAAALQQARVSIHPEHFDHNAVYHVLQGLALVLRRSDPRGRGPPRVDLCGAIRATGNGRSRATDPGHRATDTMSGAGV